MHLLVSDVATNLDTQYFTYQNMYMCVLTVHTVKHIQGISCCGKFIAIACNVAYTARIVQQVDFDKEKGRQHL